jgi:hypothetical protein
LLAEVKKNGQYRNKYMVVIDFIEKNFDDYNRQARLAPALLVSLPIVLCLVSLFPDKILSLAGLTGLVPWFGILGILAQIARNNGKATEEGLYKEWGGKPTTFLLRHSSSQNEIQLARWHKNLHQLTGEIIPNKSEELLNPSRADNIYDACVKVLIEKTRDRSKFPLIYEGIRSYGFLRNLFGMKFAGIIGSFLGVICIGIQCIFIVDLSSTTRGQYGNDLMQVFMSLKYSNIPPQTLTCLLINIFLLITWLLWVNSNAVKNAADAYAARLLGSSENLS